MIEMKITHSLFHFIHFQHFQMLPFSELVMFKFILKKKKVQMNECVSCDLSE